LEQKDRIAELCNRATTEQDPTALKKIIDELRTSLAEYIREARRMTVLHFNYFRKHETFSPQTKPARSENDTRKNVPEETPFLEDDKKKAF
jgi:hypothetical protein